MTPNEFAKKIVTAQVNETLDDLEKIIAAILILSQTPTDDSNSFYTLLEIFG